MKKQAASIIARSFVNIPFSQFDRYLPFISRYRINPEIGLDGDALYVFSRQNFQDKADFLIENGLKCTLHAPFQDMFPGAMDPNILKAVRHKLNLCFELVEIFRPESVVCHLGYLENVHSYQFADWLETSLQTWRKLLLMAEPFSTPIMFENTYEPTPEIHKTVLQALDSPLARFCLDVGHLLAFARSPWQEWLKVLGGQLGQLHLHDNKGRQDDHLPVGKGKFDFQSLFFHLQSIDCRPIITLEPRSENDLWESLNALDRLGIFDHKLN